MTIKEIEERSGMVRANIRFYESEGFLSPVRGANGYRDYSEEDLEVLMRIKLLRSLRVPLEDIKAMQDGEQELPAVLSRHIVWLESEKNKLGRSQDVCRAMQNDGVRYQTMNADRYFTLLEHGVEQPVRLPISDTVPRLCIPWRRLFARGVDLALYDLIWTAFLVFALNMPPGRLGGFETILGTLVGIGSVLLLEPLFLKLFATTPGKWILGIRVTDNHGRRLTYRAARKRTLTMLWEGMGFQIPVYDLVRRWKSYKTHTEGGTLSWEYDTELSVKDERGWRLAVLLLSWAALISAVVFLPYFGLLPRHRGDLTVAEFCDNYNRIASYLDSDNDYVLDVSGSFVDTSYQGGNVVTIYVGGGSDTRPPVMPRLVFSEEDGILTGVRFEMSYEDGPWNGAYLTVIELAVRSFAMAQKECPFFDRFQNDLLREVSSFQGFARSEYGVGLRCDISYSGYQRLPVGDSYILWAIEEVEQNYSVAFTMEKE